MKREMKRPQYLPLALGIFYLILASIKFALLGPMVDTSWRKRRVRQRIGKTYLEILGIFGREDLGVDTSLFWNVVLHVVRSKWNLIIDYKFKFLTHAYKWGIFKSATNVIAQFSIYGFVLDELPLLTDIGGQKEGKSVELWWLRMMSDR